MSSANASSESGAGALSGSRRRLIVITGSALFLVCLCAAGIFLAVSLFWPANTVEPPPDPPSVQYILDVSARMDLPAEGSDQSRLEVARGVLSEALRPADPATTAGLRVFGSGAAAQPCDDISLLVPLGPATQPQISQEIQTVRPGPSQDSALAQAMLDAIRDFSADESGRGGPYSLVVVTGGLDSCQAEAAQLIAQEAARAGIELRTFVIGFQVTTEEALAIKQIAEASGEGYYLDAPDEAALANALQLVQAYIDDPESVQLDAIVSLADAFQTATPTSTLTPTPTATATATATPSLTPTFTPTPDNIVCTTHEDDRLLPAAIPLTAGESLTSTIAVARIGPIVDVNVVYLSVTHPITNQLDIFLRSPISTTVALVEGFDCELDAPLFVGFDDAAAGEMVCRPEREMSYQPAEPLARFNGESSHGLWELILEVQEDGPGGTLHAWRLEICTLGSAQPTRTPRPTATPTRQVTPTPTTTASPTLVATDTPAPPPPPPPTDTPPPPPPPPTNTPPPPPTDTPPPPPTDTPVPPPPTDTPPPAYP